ncbi:ATP-dependent metallopeptidase FtsH/Yme1/Tma family protein, partial [Methylomicrobium sp. Wu6]|uniref:ATP-dependent metallopeptidase FtsH/Yme1/Tma family protein n=1 Tax=Methylomicrobium sp. Wu6 TaxID=3107928 RepID=UPI002DD65A11
MKTNLQTLLLLTALIVGCLLVFNQFNSRSPVSEDTIAYSDFINKVKAKQVARVEIMGDHIKMRTNDGQEYETYDPDDPHMIDDLLAAGVQIRTVAPPKQSMLMELFVSWFPMLLLIALWVVYMKRMQGGSGNGSFGKSKAKLLEEDKRTVHFADVAGCEEAKEEVVELVDFL